MQAEAAELGAEGIVGAQVTVLTHLSQSDAEFQAELNDQEHHGPPSQQWRTFIVDIYAVGTAVMPTRADHQIPPAQLVLPLEG
ncbi:MAG: hypothetical protein PVSMB4_13490 [Ktedonobacterales bacterium]